MLLINFILVCLYLYFLYFVVQYNELYDKFNEENNKMEGDDEEKEKMMGEEDMNMDPAMDM